MICSGLSLNIPAMRTACWCWRKPAFSRRDRIRFLGGTPGSCGGTLARRAGSRTVRSSATGGWGLWPAEPVLIDRELSLPQVWIEDRSRCREADIPDEIGVATKPQPARRMLERATHGTQRIRSPFPRKTNTEKTNTDRMEPSHHVADASSRDAGGDQGPGGQGIPPTVPEVRTLLAALFPRPTPEPATMPAFSQCSHRQLIARQCHGKARGSPIQ